MTSLSSFETKDHEDKMASARAYVLKKAPYFSSVVYGFIYRPVEGVRTMFCTPKMILGYDPEWAVRGTVEELAADIAHEIHHFMRGHFTRHLGFKDKARFNRAGDLAINPDLKAGGWKLATGLMGAIFPEMYDLPTGKTTEEYYDLLDGMEGIGGGGCGSGCCGGIAGNPMQQELEEALDKLPNVGRNEAEKKGIEKRMANDIKKHVEQQGRGSVPAGLQDWIKSFDDEPHVRWQDELASVLRDTTGQMQSGGDDFSMRRPSKRSIMRGFPRPGMVEYLPEVAIIRDSSGSMQQPQLMAAVREAYYVMQALGIEEVWFADADVLVATPWRRVNAPFFKTLTEVHGRGGTDFRTPIEEALKLQPKPDIIIYATDGDGTTTDMPPPNVSVVWCIVPSYYNMAPADWGHCVMVSDDKKVRKRRPLRPSAVAAAAANIGMLGDDDDDDASDDEDVDDD